MIKRNKKPVIAFLGSLPPPYGGISIGLERLLQRLEGKGYDYVVYDLVNKKIVFSDGSSTRIRNRLWWLFKYILSAKEDLICCNIVDWRLRIVVGLMSLLGKKTLISIAGQSLNDALENGGWLKKRLIIFALRRYSFIVAVNSVIKQLCLSVGVKENHVEIIPAFIPPLVKEDDFKEIPPEIWNFIENHEPIISGNAFNIVFYKNQDLYGIDMCVDLCINLKKRFSKLGFVFCIPHIGDYEYFNKMKKIIQEAGIQNNFLFVTQPFQFYPILMKSNIFVRPTNTDGDAVSLRESLFFKVPSVASDVVVRPESTIIFKNRDMRDFTLKVLELLNNYDSYKTNLDAIFIEDNAANLTKVYQNVIGCK